MPDEQGKLNQSETEKIRQWFKGHWTRDYHCPVCWTNEWLTAEHIVAPVAYSQGGMMIGGSVYPQIMVICKGCGHTLYFNAVMMGILPPPQPPKESHGGK
jgi:hypothetical protein